MERAATGGRPHARLCRPEENTMKQHDPMWGDDPMRPIRQGGPPRQGGPTRRAFLRAARATPVIGGPLLGSPVLGAISGRSSSVASGSGAADGNNLVVSRLRAAKIDGPPARSGGIAAT